MGKIKLLVVDDIAQTRKDIVRLLYFEDDMVVLGEAVDGMDALKKMGELQPDVVLMDINMPQMDGIAATERACHLYPNIAVVIISIQGESEYLKKAMVAGARDYMVKPLGSDEMANTIRSVYKQQRMRMPAAAKQSDARYSEPQTQAQAESNQQYDNSSNLNTTSRAPEQPSMQEDAYGKQREPHRNEHDFQPIHPVPPHYYTEAPASPVQEPRQQTEYQKHLQIQDEGAVQQAQSTQSRQPVRREKKEPNVAGNEHQPLGLVKVVFCGKGGVGKTTIATNLAVVLAQQEKKKVALVDFDLQFGDISVLLNLSDGQNISDLVQDSNEITEELLENYMIRHFTGIDILPAPLFPQDAEYISAEHTDKILKLLKKSYDYVIVDTAGTFDEINLMAMDLADQILLVTTRDIVTIKNTKTSLNILDSLDYREKIRVVLNRSDHDLGVEIADLEKGLEITVSHQIASDEKAVITSINKGVPVVVSFVNSELSKSFKRLCDRMINGNRHTNKAKLNKSIITRMFSL
jgi:MinD-like ATPase involved in chromosome partitioning or flagellar assembly/DNA-binding NarL/FixJ family response regulator